MSLATQDSLGATSRIALLTTIDTVEQTDDLKLLREWTGASDT